MKLCIVGIHQWTATVVRDVGVYGGEVLRNARECECGRVEWQPWSKSGFVKLDEDLRTKLVDGSHKIK